MTPQIIFGPPGTGKTTELMRIIEEELKIVGPDELAFVTFTTEGANIGKRRAIEKFGYKERDLPYFRTLHSIAFQSIGLSRGDVISKTNYKDFSDKLGMHFTGYYTEDLHHSDDMFLFFDELYRNNPKAAKVYLPLLDAEKLTYVRRNYREFKKHFSIVDYTDMIEIFCAKKCKIPVKVAIIDEAQDLTTLQWRMVFTAFRDCERMYIAGDDDQAIYQWSGADVDYFLGIDGDVRILKHSYRLPGQILRYAKRVTSQISKRVDKDYEGSGDDGFVDIHGSLNDIEINDTDSYMFLSRNNMFLTEVENFVMSKGVIYRRKGKLSASKADYNAIITYEKCRANGTVDIRSESVLFPYVKKDYRIQDPWYDSFDWDPERLLYFRDLVRRKTSIEDVRTTIGTIHSVKGGEADHVIVLLDVTRNVADNIERNPDSEHRAFYVGFTRAKKSLHIIQSASKYSYKVY